MSHISEAAVLGKRDNHLGERKEFQGKRNHLLILFSCIFTARHEVPAERWAGQYSSPTSLVTALCGFCGCHRLKQGNIKEAVPLDLLGTTNYKTCAGAGWKIHSAASPASLLFAYGCYSCRSCVLLPILSQCWCIRVTKADLSGCLSPRWSHPWPSQAPIIYGYPFGPTRFWGNWGLYQGLLFTDSFGDKCWRSLISLKVSNHDRHREQPETPWLCRRI